MRKPLERRTRNEVGKCSDYLSRRDTGRHLREDTGRHLRELDA